MFPTALLRVLTVSIPVPLVIIAAVLLWLHLDKGSTVRKAVDQAVEELVLSSEKTALEAQLKQERHLRQVGERANEALSRILAEVDRRDAAETEKREQEIADYEGKLAAAGRSCLLDHNDIIWLRQQ